MGAVRGSSPFCLAQGVPRGLPGRRMAYDTQKSGWPALYRYRNAEQRLYPPSDFLRKKI